MVPGGPVNTIKELLTDEQVASLPQNRIEAVYTRGAETQAFEKVFQASGADVTSAACSAETAAISAQNVREAVQLLLIFG